MTKLVHVMVSGRVQGVSYRAWCVGQAEQLGLDGWVRNRSDGAVEAVFSGPASRVDAAVEACRIGPPAARVDDVRLIEPGGSTRATAGPMAQGAGFRILATL